MSGGEEAAAALVRESLYAGEEGGSGGSGRMWRQREEWRR